jgi:hypothetical protein
MRDEKMKMREIIKRVRESRPGDIYLDKDIEMLKKSIHVDVRQPRRKH